MGTKEIAQRIAQLIEYKTGGSRVIFADKIGWTKQHLNNVLSGKGLGLGTIETLITTFPDLSARWLILGEGNMLELGALHLGARYERIKSLEQYIPVMTNAEVELLAAGKAHFTENDLMRWKALKDEKQRALDERFAAAYARQGMTYKKGQL